MAEPGQPARPRAENCPRCGAALRFEDDDGTRECVCGWSERQRVSVGDVPDAADAEQSLSL